jgi:LysM repeat protein
MQRTYFIGAIVIILVLIAAIVDRLGVNLGGDEYVIVIDGNTATPRPNPGADDLPLTATALAAGDDAQIVIENAPTHTLTPNLTPATATPSPTPTVESFTYTLQSGDTMFAIAQFYGVNIEDILAINDIEDPGQLIAGETLNIPGDATTPTPTSPPTQPVTPVAQVPTSSPTLGVLPTTTPTTIPTPTAFQGIALENFIVMPPPVIANVQLIYARGQGVGRNPRAFSKLGDSTIENPHFMTRFDNGPYNLGEYSYLQGVIDHYAGSFARQGVAVRRGLHSWSALDPVWAGGGCNRGETVLACEIRLHNPSVLFVRLGSNDVGVPSAFERNMRQIIEYTTSQGVIPVIGTKADRHEGSNINNEILRKLADEYYLPLWDFDLIAATLPGRGLTHDGVHMTTFFAHDWTQPTAMTRGSAVHSLTALMVLDYLLLMLDQT